MSDDFGYMERLIEHGDMERKRKKEEAMMDSPLMAELDAITEGKSKLDLAEEIWRLKREVAHWKQVYANACSRVVGSQ